MAAFTISPFVRAELNYRFERTRPDWSVHRAQLPTHRIGGDAAPIAARASPVGAVAIVTTLGALRCSLHALSAAHPAPGGLSPRADEGSVVAPLRELSIVVAAQAVAWERLRVLCGQN